MTTQRERAIGGGCFGGIVGALLGVLVGGVIGHVTPNEEHDLRNDPHPMVQQVGMLLAPVDACFGFFGMLVGVGVGGNIGGIAGSVTGAGLASSKRRQIPPESVLTDSPSSCDESVDSEITQMREKVAELEKRKSSKGRGPAPD
jgi:hypothetical protein